jgi:hypothetical protein
MVLDSYRPELRVEANQLDGREGVLLISVLPGVELSIRVRFAVDKVPLPLVSLAYIGRK